MQLINKQKLLKAPFLNKKMKNKMSGITHNLP